MRLARTLPFAAAALLYYPLQLRAQPAVYLPDCTAGSSTWEFSIRADFNDLGPLACPYANAPKPQGATFSGTRNLATDQNSLAVDGLAVLDYRFLGTGNFVGFAFGTYVQLDDTMQLEPTKTQQKNGDTITPGAVAEAAVLNPILSGYDTFRIRGGAGFASTWTTSETMVGEWIPSYFLKGLNDKLPDIGIPDRLWILDYVLTPELMIQYDSLVRGTSANTIFSSRAEALRIGPQVVLKLGFDEDLLDKIEMNKGLKTTLKNLSATLTNHESWDVYTNKYYTWNAISVTYTIPQFQAIGITATYGNGNAEATGNQTNQFKIGVSLKLTEPVLLSP